MKTILKIKYIIIWLILWFLITWLNSYAATTQTWTLWELFEKIWSVYRLVWDNIKDDTIDTTEIENNTLTVDDLWTNSVWNDELIDAPLFNNINFEWWLNISWTSKTFNVKSNDSNTIINSFLDKEGDNYWYVYWDQNWNRFWLLDWSWNWSYLAVKDNFTSFRIDDDEKMRLSVDWNITVKWQIKNVSTPTEPNDVATKFYVDTKVPPYTSWWMYWFCDIQISFWDNNDSHSCRKSISPCFCSVWWSGHSVSCSSWFTKIVLSWAPSASWWWIPKVTYTCMKN